MLWYFFGRVAHLNPKQYINLIRYRHEFGERQKEGQQWFGYKLHWSEQRKSVVLVAGPIGLEQKDPSSNKVPDNGDFGIFQWNCHIARTGAGNVLLQGHRWVG